MIKQPIRKNIRLQDYDYKSPGHYFITICCYKRRCIFGKINDGIAELNKLGKIVEFNIHRLEKYRDVKLDTYIVMPNHIHLILELNDEYLPHVLRLFKNETIKHAKRTIWTSSKLWQRGYYEHIIRTERSLQALREYILNNPIKWEIDRENPKFHD